MQTTKNANVGGNQQTISTPKPARVSVPVKLDAGKTTASELTIPKGLGKDTFVMTFAGTEGTLFQLTVHHPIGYTPMNGEAWVCTPSEDIPTLLGRTDHPGAKKIKSVLEVERQRILEEAGYISVEVNTVWWLIGDQQVESAKALEGAENAWKEAKKAHLAEHEAKQAGKPKAAKYHGYPLAKEDFLSETQKEFLDGCAAFIKRDGRVAALKHKLEGDYQTMGGPLGDRPQRPFLKKGGRQRAVDVLVAQLMGVEDPSPPDVEEEEPAKPKGQKQEPEASKKGAEGSKDTKKGSKETGGSAG